MSVSLTLDAAQVMEHFQWKSSEEITEYTKSHKTAISNHRARGEIGDMISCHSMTFSLLYG